MGNKLTQYAVISVPSYGSQLMDDYADTLDEVEEIISRHRLIANEYGQSWVVMAPLSRSVKYERGYTLPAPLPEPEVEEEAA